MYIYIYIYMCYCVYTYNGGLALVQRSGSSRKPGIFDLFPSGFVVVSATCPRRLSCTWIAHLKQYFSKCYI